MVMGPKKSMRPSKANKRSIPGTDTGKEIVRTPNLQVICRGWRSHYPKSPMFGKSLFSLCVANNIFSEKTKETRKNAISWHFAH